MEKLCLLLASLLVVLSTIWAGEPANPTVASDKSFDYSRDIKPILAKHCASCHGVEKQKSGLRLDTAAAAMRGGDTGPAIVPGKSAESLLFQALTGAEGVTAMPPKGQPQLSAEQIALFKAWIDQGAKAPADEAGAAVVKRSNHWSFQPVVRPAVPVVKEQAWVRNPIDAFILARLEPQSLAPAAEADRVTLIRRLSLDLLGLPPSPQEVDEFLADTRADAYEQLVDRLLASPHYGERWGRHWLDLARYADSNGFTRDFARAIWKYREWVIGALNRDLPFDQFTIEQIAGDMLPKATLEQQIATGFHRNTLINEEGGTDPEQFRVESVVDRVSTTSTVFLGLTIGCAQCHDHKYDPIAQREFYRFYAFLNNADEPKLDVPTPEQVQAGAVQKRDEIRRQIAALENEIKAREQEFNEALLAWEKSLTDDDKKVLPFDVVNTVSLSPGMRSEQNKKDLVAYFKKVDVARQKFPVLDEVNKLRDAEPKFITTMVMQERDQPRATHIHIRGDFLRHGAKVEPGVPDVLPPLSSDIKQPTRLDLAKWLVDPRNPLTPRVTVNRVWQKYFGRGIVETENDFGLQGTPPTHPELLDWLATEFAAPPPATDNRYQKSHRFDVKALIRLIVTSATYQQSSRLTPALLVRDPENRLLARGPRLRLSAEMVRDQALAASGLLVEKLGGPSVKPYQPDGLWKELADTEYVQDTGPNLYRRSMYTYFKRTVAPPTMMTFDAAGRETCIVRETRTNTPLQALTLMNEVTFVEASRALAERVMREGGTTPGDRIGYAFRLTTARLPRPAELSVLEQGWRKHHERFQKFPQAADDLTRIGESPRDDKLNVAELAAYTTIAGVILNLDEAITKE